ncbi:hypothetical protein CI105_08410 [Candidatus Izimaplasma bacterium ZiA1]|uniref:DUF4435 domain-containing protein n=1 Tax=Candidatus Izimoplasma sp. ZiA1 TaxID=2024899 RepID=UPI000BAA8834|nr:hypothetical protein CI105_08410 [Candidatus Izimaplasma bacterium ZiA1]
MTSLVSTMDEQRKTLSTLLLEFMSISRSSEPKSICFFEGHDAKYYSTRVEQYSSKKLVPFVCYGKGNVLGMKDYSQNFSSYDTDTHLFFVDRDFDENDDVDDEIYLTCCYSIENNYFDRKSFSSFINQELLITEYSITHKDKKDYSKIMDFYDTSMQIILSQQEIVNAWFKLQKQFNTVTGHYPDLSKVRNLKDFSSIGCINDLENITPGYIEISSEKLSETIQELKSNSICNFRGKFIMSEYLGIINRILYETNIRNKNKGNRTLVSKRRKTNFKELTNVEEGLRMLSSNTITPDCLKKYLNQYCK